MIQLPENDWAFIPGPPEILDPPGSNLNWDEIAAYPPEAIAQAFLDCEIHTPDSFVQLMTSQR